MNQKTYKLWELHRPDSRSYILVDGDYVINGDYYVECDSQHDRIRIKNYHKENEWFNAYYLDEVSNIGDYNDIINKYDKERI